MASKTYEYNSLDTNVNGTQVTAIMIEIQQLTLGLAGKIRFSSSVLGPKLKYTTGKSVFDTGTFDVHKWSLFTATDRFRFR